MIGNSKKLIGGAALLVAVILFFISTGAVGDAGAKRSTKPPVYTVDTASMDGRADMGTGAETESNSRSSSNSGVADEEKVGDARPKYSELLMSLTTEVPILLYQHMDEDEAKIASTVITPEIFEEHIITLIDNGYTAISFIDIINYVESGTELPEKPVIITFDDGYLSTYEYAFPILKKYNVKATLFAIGMSIGKHTYRDTESEEYAIIARFSYEQAREMTATGLIMVQSHSYDMHQWDVFEERLGGEYRDGAMPLEGESEEEYRANFIEDFELARDGLMNELGTDMIVYAYPHGKYTSVTEEILREMGVKATVTLDHGSNDLIIGRSDTLYDLSRLAITPISGEELLKTLEVNRVVINYEDGADEVLPRNMRWMLK